MDVTLRNSRIKLPLGKMFWREVGRGPILIFLHGTWNDGSQWLPLIEHLHQNYHCFAPDLLGFGDSEKPNVHYSIQLEVEFLRQYLDALRLPEVYLIAHSLGGWIAASYALKDSDRVRGVVLLAPEGVQTEGQQKNLPWLKWLVGLPKIPDRILRALLPLARLLKFNKGIEQALEKREQLLAFPTACKLLFQRRRVEIQAELLEDSLNELTVPMLIIQGKNDTPDAVERSKIYGKKTAKTQLILIDRIGNNLLEELPDAIAKYIDDFVKSQEFKA